MVPGAAGETEIAAFVRSGRSARASRSRRSAPAAAGHTPGEVSIPLEQLADRRAEIPADAAAVAYCRGRYCVLSYDAVRLLHARGHNAALLADGIVEWRRDGLPVTGRLNRQTAA